MNLCVTHADQALNALWRSSAALKLVNETDTDFTTSLHCSGWEFVSYFKMHTIPPSIPSIHPSVSINPALQDFNVSIRYSAPFLKPFALRSYLRVSSCLSSLMRSCCCCKFWMRTTN